MIAKGQADLGHGSIGKTMAKMAIPCITAQIINVLYNMVDRIYIGHMPDVGSTALTGVGLSMPIIMIITAFSNLIGVGGSPRVAMSLGRKDRDSAEEILGNCVSALVCISIIITAAVLIFNEKLLYLFGASSDSVGYGADYLRIYALGTIFVQLVLGLNVFITAQGFASVSMKTTVIGAVLNIILDPIFIYALNMGVAGAALATIISQAVSAAWVLKFLTGKKSPLNIRKKYLRLKPAVILPVLALGVSSFVMLSTESILSACLSRSLQRYGGDNAVAAMTILTSVLQFTTMPVIGLTQGAMPMISYNYGAKNSERVKKTCKLLVICGTIYTIVMWGLSMLIPGTLAEIFTDNSVLIDLTAWAMRIYMAATLVLGIQFSFQQSFVALGEAKYASCLALLRKVILLIPLIYILPNFFADKVFAVFLAEPIADVLSTTTTSIVFINRIRKLMRQLDEEKESEKQSLIHGE